MTPIANSPWDVFFSKRKFAEAEASYLKAVASNPAGATPWLDLGELYSYQSKPERAIDAFRKASKLRPGHAGRQWPTWPRATI